MNCSQNTTNVVLFQLDSALICLFESHFSHKIFWILDLTSFFFLPSSSPLFLRAWRSPARITMLLTWLEVWRLHQPTHRENSLQGQPVLCMRNLWLGPFAWSQTPPLADVQSTPSTLNDTTTLTFSNLIPSHPFRNNNVLSPTWYATPALFTLHPC